MVKRHRRTLSTATIVGLAITVITFGVFFIALAYANEKLNWIDVIF